MRFTFFCLIAFFSINVCAQQKHKTDSYKLVAGEDYVQTKNYYLLTLLQWDKTVQAILEKDTTLAGIARKKREKIQQAFQDCKTDALCYTTELKLTDEEIAAVGARLKALYHIHPALKKLVSEQLIRSGTYIQFNKAAPDELLQKAWEQDAHGINFVISVYGEGAKPNYPAIDSISFDTKNNRFAYLLYTLTYNILNETQNASLCFKPSLLASLQLLELNERSNAGDYEPMETTVNKAAVQKIKTVKWDSYPYTLILIPGAGPDDSETALSAEAKLRLRMGAFQYLQNKAPFIVVSGGKVHPYKTKYNEAEEMKRYLIQTLQIPENAVIMEPHARHTTTNLRNCVRLVYRYGMPLDKPCITSTSRFQSNMISTTLPERCKKELDTVPYKLGKRLSETEVEFYPLEEALHIDPTEPMDP